MEPDLAPFVHSAVLRLDGADLADVGAAVTSALCRTWTHDGPCRFPHDSAREGSADQGSLDLPGLHDTVGFRTLFVAPVDDEEQVRELIDDALRFGRGWSAVATGARELADDEEELAARLVEAAAR